MVRIRVKVLAKQKGISMGKLSRQADIAYRTIQHIYNDPTYIPTLSTLEQIAMAPSVPTADLIEDILSRRREQMRTGIGNFDNHISDCSSRALSSLLFDGVLEVDYCSSYYSSTCTASNDYR